MRPPLAPSNKKAFRGETQKPDSEPMRRAFFYSDPTYLFGRPSHLSINTLLVSNALIVIGQKNFPTAC